MVQITGKIVKYQNDPVIYVTHPEQIIVTMDVSFIQPSESSALWYAIPVQLVKNFTVTGVHR